MKMVTVLAVIATLMLLVTLMTGAAATESLPSTGTDSQYTPLVVLGTVILATGVVLLRRPVIVPNP
jgi:LPXTG-motif cell wall-anchored protein